MPNMRPVRQVLAATQRGPIAAAAELLTSAIRGGKSLFSFGATHSFILTGTGSIT